jgi:Holliday junction resolvase RusA-like endonuclease
VIEILIPGEIIGKQRHRATKTGRMYTPPNTVDFEKMVGQYAAMAMSKQNAHRERGPVSMDLGIYVVPPKSWSKKKKDMALRGEILPTSKPDISNMQKGIEDGMNEIVYDDDSQIVISHAYKIYGPEAGARIRINPINFLGVEPFHFP